MKQGRIQWVRDSFSNFYMKCILVMSMLWLSVVDGQIHVPVATQFLLLVKKVSHLQRTFPCVATQFWESENGTLFLHGCATCILMSIYLG